MSAKKLLSQKKTKRYLAGNFHDSEKACVIEKIQEISSRKFLCQRKSCCHRKNSRDIWQEISMTAKKLLSQKKSKRYLAGNFYVSEKACVIEKIQEISSRKFLCQRKSLCHRKNSRDIQQEISMTAKKLVSQKKFKRYLAGNFYVSEKACVIEKNQEKTENGTKQDQINRKTRFPACLSM